MEYHRAQQTQASFTGRLIPFSNERLRSKPRYSCNRVVYPSVSKVCMHVPITQLAFDFNASRSRSVKSRLNAANYRQSWRTKTPVESFSLSTRDSPRTNVAYQFEANKLIEKLKISFECSKHSKLLSARSSPMKKRYVHAKLFRRSP
jgi:hypothetical protein